jgi:hypothetical protein
MEKPEVFTRGSLGARFIARIGTIPSQFAPTVPDDAFNSGTNFSTWCAGRLAIEFRLATGLLHGLRFLVALE